MLIKGNTIQNGIPSPDNPIDIINEVFIETKNGKNSKINIDLKGCEIREGEYIFKQNGEWHILKMFKGDEEWKKI